MNTVSGRLKAKSSLHFENKVQAAFYFGARFRRLLASLAAASAEAVRHITFNHFKQTRAGSYAFRFVVRQGLLHFGGSGFKFFRTAPTGNIDEMVFAVRVNILMQTCADVARLGFQEIA